MKMQDRPRTRQLLKIVQVLAWLAIIGFMIEAGAILISYFVSTVNPDAAKNLYKGLNLYHLRQLNFWRYTLAVFFWVVLPMIKSAVCFLIYETLSKLNLKNHYEYEK
jgi:peptidase E